MCPGRRSIRRHRAPRGARGTADALQSQLGFRSLDGIRARRHHHRTEPESVAEEVLQHDGPARRDRVVQLGVERAQDTPGGQLGHQLVDRLVQLEDPLLHQRQGRRGDDGLGERGDPKDGVVGQRGVVGHRRVPDGPDVDVGAVGHEEDQSRHVAGSTSDASWSCTRSSPPRGSGSVEISLSDRGPLLVRVVRCRRRAKHNLIEQVRPSLDVERPPQFHARCSR